ncbi:MAG: hypothetical protein VB084_13555 [Syntrophomonadaceae bacterium]|nr:hypothetical protein [Syntrophomonadaceae bacterium]
MNIDKLEVNYPYKNYNHLCQLLNIPSIRGNTKKKVLNELARYVKFHNEGQKIIIDEKYQIPKPKIDKRGRGENSRAANTIYGKYIDKLILDVLAQNLEKNMKTVSFSKFVLLRELEMINQDYTKGLDNKGKAAELLNMNLVHVEDFFNNSYSKLKKTLESSLNRLSCKSLITWKPVIIIVIQNGNERETHVADDYEERLITSLEVITMKELKCSDRREVVISSKWSEFKNRVNKMVKDQEYKELEKFKDFEGFEGFKYYYRGYKFNYNDFIIEELERVNRYLLEYDDRLKTKRDLNETLVTNYKASNKTRFSRNVEDKKICDELSIFQPHKVSASYVKDHDLLVDKYIKN